MKSEKVVKVVKALPIPSKWPVSVVSGIFVIVVFWSFTFTSMAFFPIIYNPLVNWMSDLGNSNFNPKGAFIFNIGCVITGIALFPFFIGLYEWYIGGRRNKIFTQLTQIAGFFSAFALIMIGVFPENYVGIHIFWAATLFILTMFTFIFPSIALYKYKFTRNIAKYGFFAAGINLTLWIFIVPLLEWLTIITSFIFIGIIIESMYRRIEKLRFVRKNW